jgi:hypothetical protein
MGEPQEKPSMSGGMRRCCGSGEKQARLQLSVTAPFRSSEERKNLPVRNGEKAAFLFTVLHCSSPVKQSSWLSARLNLSSFNKPKLKP